MEPEMRTEAIVVGAGAAGLAAAACLTAAGVATIVLEARDRLGGRIATILDPRGAVPIELGAEFVHGTPEVTLELLRRAGRTVVDDASESWQRGPTGLEPVASDPFAAVKEFLVAAAASARERGADESVEAALARARPDAEVAAWTRGLVGGFDAADPARASLLAIADEWSGAAAAGGAQSRPLGAYAPLVAHLARSIDPTRGRVLTEHVVRAVRTNATGASVEVERPSGERAVLRARYVVVTVPLGVLQRPAPEGIVFDPPHAAARVEALGRIVMGPVRKVVLSFAHAFWERIDGGRLRDVAFFHQTTGAFPTFWTQLPVRAPFVVAWAGGPAADAIHHLDDAAVARRALAEFGALVGDAAAAAAAFTGALSHDWQRDPWSFGAYSYAAVGGANARLALGAPAERLSFAGEATAPEGEVGTVAGALLSGERAAREAIASLAEAPAE